jgi:hypothetical protein
LSERFGSTVRKLLLDQLRSQNSDKTIFHYPKTDKKRANPVKWICPAENNKNTLQDFLIEDFSPL